MQIYRKLLKDGVGWIRLLGEALSGSAGVKVLMKDPNGNIMMAFTQNRNNIPQAKAGFARGCLLFTDGYGPRTQNAKALYENVGNAELSRFNVVGAVTDPEILIPKGRLLIGQKNGYAMDVLLSGEASVTPDGVVTLDQDLAQGKIYIGDSEGDAAEQTVSGVILLSEAGVTSFGAQYAYSHRIVTAGLTEGVVDADGELSVNSWKIATGDIGFATLYDASHDVHVTRVQCKEERMDVTLSGAGGTNTRIQYQVLRAVGTDPSNPATTDAPTTQGTTEPPFASDAPTTLSPTTSAPTTSS